MTTKGTAYKWLKEQRKEDLTDPDRLYLKFREAERPLAKIYWTYRWNLYCHSSCCPILARHKIAWQEIIRRLREE